MATETKVQHFVHALEEGGWVRRFKILVMLSAIATSRRSARPEASG